MATRNFTQRKIEHCADCGEEKPKHNVDCYRVVSFMRAGGKMCKTCHCLLASGAKCWEHPDTEPPER